MSARAWFVWGVIVVATSLATAACAPNAHPDGSRLTSGDRFTVRHVGTFDAAYEDRASQRSLYVIHDRETGTDYLAVEGCGTAQLVSNGKHVEEQ